ncbi:MAG: hypothetical protein ACTTKA_09710 [Tannerella sp.]
MRFARRRDACRPENQVTRFASDSLIFFRLARCSVGSPPEAQGTNAEAFACFPYAALPHSPFEGITSPFASLFPL